MPDFSSLFVAAKGGAIEYKGRTLIMMDRYPVQHGRKFLLSLISSNSPWKQGIKLGAKGAIYIAGQTLTKGVLLWEDTMPKEVVLQVDAKDSLLQVSNAWDTGDGVTHSWHNGAAIYVEVEENGRRIYHCNDGHPDENFDDLVFSIEPVCA
ncbi:hypothetical protein [Shewanella xiamenensis]|uniref:hypothetical protein n=1 Tax=Shewanella xiamenensis TaxID=332186 RepID=UPI001C4FC407|nr:hypothetical protein [Shewanella xiamenensis]MBW0281672.1 hypothetical protein [Shewanella xiamenensis]MCT8870847.1 hypothetical protein [Shewanella xiamenensis]UWH40437.1 hypothetical protein KXJ80_14145 [Shewanella xiamenensis]